MNKPREFFIFLPSGTRKLGETKTTWHSPKIVKKKGFDGWGGSYITVREVRPEDDTNLKRLETRVSKLTELLTKLGYASYVREMLENE